MIKYTTSLKEIIDILNKNKISFQEINTFESDLEDIFLKLVKGHMKITNHFFLLAFMLVPVLLITGPALPRHINYFLCIIFFI